tara:strand:+ start:729 stop:959 length:231 start_codon:yes stop_codon:yes gene_type:complete
MVNIVIACLISIVLTIVIYIVHNKCTKEETNKNTMSKLLLLSVILTTVTYFLTTGNTGVSSTNLNAQEVLTGDPGF